METLQKSTITKRKIMNAATMLFAGKGFESTTTREICTAADVNLSLISYYFKTKEGLYACIIDSVLNYGLKYMEKEILETENLANMSKSEKIELYKRLLNTFAEFLYSDNVPNSFVILMIKEQTSPNSTFSELYVKKINILYSALRRILSSITGTVESDKKIIFTVSTIVGQILSWKIMNRATLQALKQKEYTSEDKKRINQIVENFVEEAIMEL
ncbi:CerR family C-terminal domain-containing protein [bacterium]|nr:CerR family C-terminal domain-containing protein [bacterium]